MPISFTPSLTKCLILPRAVRGARFPSFSFIFSPFSSRSDIPQPCDTQTPASFISEFLLNECGFRLSEVSKVIKKNQSLLRIRSTQRAREAVEFMRDRGFTQHHIRKTIYGHPGVLVLKVHGRLKLKFDFLETLGFHDEDLPNFICRSPRLLGYSLENNLRPKVPYLEELFGGKANLGKALKRAPGLLRINMEKQEPKLELFKQCGVQGELLSSLISNSPIIFTLSVELLKSRIAYVRSMGILEGSKVFVRALCVVVSISPQTYEKKLKHLASLGLTEDEVRELVKKHPRLCALATNKMHENMDFLVGTAGFAPQIVLTNPVLFNFSVEKRLKPRHAVFKALCSREQSNPSLLDLFMSSEKDFIRKFVECHSERSILKEIYCNAKDADVTTT